MVSRQPVVSIVMPVYNGSHYIEASIESVISQTYQDWELICVDDSSTDHSLDILRNFSNVDPRIRVYVKPNERFGNRATKYGIDRAKGEYLIYMSQDDKLSPDLLEKNFQAIKSYHVDAVVPMMKYYDRESGQCVDFLMPDVPNIINGREAFILSLDWKLHGFAMWPMATVKTIGWGTESLNDDEFTTRMLYYHTERIGFSEGVFYYHNHNPEAITVKWSINQLDFLKTDAKIYYFLLDNNFDASILQIVFNMTKGDLLRIIVMLSRNYHHLNKEQRKSACIMLMQAYKTYKPIFKQAKMKLKEKIVLSNAMIFRWAVYFKCHNV